LLVRNERARQVHEREIVAGRALPPDEQRTEAVVPAIGALDHPAPRLPADASEERRLAAMANVRRDPARADTGLAIGIVVGLVETAVLGAPRPAPRFEHDRIERRGERPLVVDIRPREDHRERDPTTVGEDVPLDAQLPAVRRVRSREVPPFGALTMTESSALHVQ